MEHSLDRVRKELPLELTELAARERELKSPPAAGKAMSHTVSALSDGRVRTPTSDRTDTPVALQAVEGSSGAADLHRAQQSMRTLRAFADGSTAPTWTLRFELARSHGELKVKLVQPSDFPALDVFVQRHASRWVREQRAASPDFMVGIRRALWEVDAFVHYRQRTEDLSPLDLAGIAATSLLTGLGKGRVAEEKQPDLQRGGGLALTFNFDEVTGKTEVVNLAAPQYRLELRLLEAELDATDGGA